MRISVIICTHNPVAEYLEQVLASLKSQTLSLEQWELIIVDNKSLKPVIDGLDTSWHPDSAVYVEEKLGLIHARICGVTKAAHEILVTVDDDTPLHPEYLENVLRIYQANPKLGIIGGKTIPQFETDPPGWLKQFYGLLAIRDLGDKPIIDELGNRPLTAYPTCAPLLIAPLKSCMLKYLDHYRQDGLSKELGRKGEQLSSGEDNDINLFIYSQGYELGYFPELKFTHIIPKRRMEVDYLGRLNFSSNATWVKVLAKYNINPWPRISRFSVPLRNAKAWLTYAAWRSPENYVKWRGACGMFKGLSEL